MTHLPEVEVLRKDLEKELVGKRVKDVTVKAASILGDHHRNRPEFAKLLEGRKLEAVTRRGANLVIELDEGKVLVLRLGEQATVSRETATEEAGKHTQVVATFTTGGALHLIDPGTDSVVFVTDSQSLHEDPALNPTGMDPLADTVPWHEFSQRLRDEPKALKAVLTDESFMVGLGPLYSDEILWAAGLSGTRTSATLSSQEIRRLYRAVLEVLFEAVKQGGAVETDSDSEDPFGDGDFGEHIKVYGKAGQPCARCRRPIQKGKIVGRLSGFFCAQCQT